MKNICSWIGMAAMLSPSVIPSIYPPPTDRLSLFKWKLLLIVISLIGLLAFGLHLVIQHREEKKRKLEEANKEIEREKREMERDKRYEELASLLRPKPEPIAVPLEVEPLSNETMTEMRRQEVRNKALQLGKDLFAFLREKGPDPEVVLDKNQSLEKQIKHVMEVRGPYVEGVHYGYMAHFRDRVVKMFNELAEIGIPFPSDLKSWEIDPPQVQNAERVRKIAENLFLIATRMEIADQAKGT